MLAGALVLVLGALRVYGWVSLQRAERRLGEVLGGAAAVAPPAAGRKETTAGAIEAALAALDIREELVVELSELAMLPAVPMDPEQQRWAERALAGEAAAVAVLYTLPERPVGRLGRWDRIEPEEEGKLQAGVLTLAQLAAVDGRVACEERDGERLERSLAVLGGLATALEMEGEFQPLMLGSMIEHMQHLLLARGLQAGMADGAAGSRLEATLGGADLRHAYRRALAGRVARLAALRSPLVWSPGGLRSWLADVVYFDLWLARSLDSLIAQAAEVDRPLLPRLLAMGSMPGVGPAAAAGSLDLPARLQLVLAGRGMAKAALALWRRASATGSYPRELSDVPEAAAALSNIGIGVRFERLANGGARLFVPGADEVLRVLAGDPKHPALLGWELPAASRPRS